MAITVTVPDRVQLSNCDAITNWTATVTWTTAHVADGDEFIEGAGSIGARASSSGAGVATNFYAHYTTTANLNLSTGMHLYFWVNCTSIPSTANREHGGIGVSLSSTAGVTETTTYALPWRGIADSKQWFVGGANVNATDGWVCYVIDPSSTADLSLGTPVVSSVDRVGIRSCMLQAVGAGSFKPHNYCWDSLSYGQNLTMIGSTGTFALIEAEDAKTANRYGMLLKSNGIFFGQSKLAIGTAAQAAATVFTDTGQVFVWSDQRVAAGFYEIKLTANGAGNPTTFTLGAYSGGLASGGCTVRGTGLSSQRLIAATIVAGGTGYTAGNILTVSGGTGTAATMKVVVVSGGVITELRMETSGSYSVPPTGTLTLTGGSGASATATATVVGGSIWTLTCGAANTTANLYGNSFSEMKAATFGAADTLRFNVFDNFGNITATGCLIDSCTFQNLRTATPISATYAVDAVTTVPTITNSKFINCATALRWPMAFDPNTKLDGTTFISGGAGHAIEFTGAPTSRTLTNVTFTGYSGTSTNAAIFVNTSAGSMSLTISGTGTTPSIRVAAGVTVTVISGTVATTITTVTATGAVVGSARVHLRAANGTGPLPYADPVTITRVTTTATVAHTAHGMVTDDKVVLRGITDKTGDNKVFQITRTSDNEYTYQTTDSGSTSYTGSITATWVALDGESDPTTGVMTMSRTYTGNQPVTGWARKMSDAPFYKEGPINGTILAASGLSISAVMVSDE